MILIDKSADALAMLPHLGDLDKPYSSPFRCTSPNAFPPANGFPIAILPNRYSCSIALTAKAHLLASIAPAMASQSTGPEFSGPEFSGPELHPVMTEVTEHAADATDAVGPISIGPISIGPISIGPIAMASTAALSLSDAAVPGAVSSIAPYDFAAPLPLFKNRFENEKRHRYSDRRL